MVCKIVIGGERSPAVTDLHRRQHGFWASLGDRRHIDTNLDRVLAMRFPFHFGGWQQEWILEASTRHASRAKGVVEFDLIRMSSRTLKTEVDAKLRCPVGIHEFRPGTGAGAVSLTHVLQLACAARCEGYAVKVNVKGEIDRYIRSGVALALLIMRRAGIKITYDGLAVDKPWLDEIDFGQSEHRPEVATFAKRMDRHLRAVFVAAELGEVPPDLPRLDGVSRLRGLSETLSCGAGLDFLLRDEASADGIGSAHQIGNLAQLPPYRTFAGVGGYWLMAPGYRHLRRLKGDSVTGLIGRRFAAALRPLVLEGHENACMLVLQARWPHASFLEPIIMKKTWLDPRRKQLLLHKPIELLSKLKGETLVCVDHAMVHFGSALDLDVMLRQQRCSLHAVLPSSWLHPRISVRLLKRVPAMIEDARRIALDMDQSATQEGKKKRRSAKSPYKVKKGRCPKPRLARVPRDKPRPDKMYPNMA